MVRSQVENKYLGISAENEKAAYDMLANIVYILPYRRKLEQYISANNQGSKACGLWDCPVTTIVALNIYSRMKRIS